MARILVIDDDPLARITVRMVLERHGHQILEAENGSVGIAVDAEYRAALIITDIIMPEKEGIETIRHLRETRPSVKIIAISGGGWIGNRTTLGADRVLTKPISNCDLIGAVDACLTEPALA